MPRRKAESSVGEEPSSKKPAVVSDSSSEINGSVVRFEWEADAGKWTAYNEDDNAELITAYNNSDLASAKKQAVLEKAGDITLLVKFDHMVQKNKSTGWERRIRCTVQDKDGDYYIWQWEDEKSHWNPYNIINTCDLEEGCRKELPNVSFTAAGRNYTVNLKFNQQVNDETGISKKIDRVKSDANVEPKPKKSGKKEAAKGRSGRSGVKVEPTTNGDAAKSGARGKSGGKMSKREMEREGKEIVKTVVITGKAPVDPECTLSGKSRVFCEGDDVWDCMLNQTNIINNNNKYFLIQLLQEEKNKSYYVWLRWGRVGYSGQNNLVPCGSDLNKAKNVFSKKFEDKTKNSWDERDCFEKVQGKYDMLKMDYTAKGAGDKAGGDTIKREPSEKCPDSKLDNRLQSFIQLICDVKLMEEAVIEMKYDAKKAPLGKLTKGQITAGYSALKKIDVCIQRGEFSRALEQACSEFYTRIPHDFGMRQPPLIRTKQELKDKIQLLEALDDIEIAMRTLETGDMSMNPVDRHYESLHCDLKPLDKKDEMFEWIEQYVENTHAKTHRQYKMKVEQVFDCEREKEKENFTDYGNKMLLWHGSRLSNWVGILSQGLRIAPPEAPVTGYMFGKGVYFADMSSKSANYCFASSSKNTGILLLCEVSLGDCNELLSADYNANKLPKGCNSVKGIGSVAPDPSGNKTMPDGVVIPMGKGHDTGVKNPSGYTLNYNEFIVYSTKQIKMRYLVQTKFDFK